MSRLTGIGNPSNPPMTRVLHLDEDVGRPTRETECLLDLDHTRRARDDASRARAARAARLINRELDVLAPLLLRLPEAVHADNRGAIVRAAGEDVVAVALQELKSAEFSRRIVNPANRRRLVEVGRDWLLQ